MAKDLLGLWGRSSTRLVTALLAGGHVLIERPGTTATPRRGQGHEVREIRPFAEGDDPRHIDAAATVRTGSPQLRSVHEDRERSAMLIADFRRSMFWGTKGGRRCRAVGRGRLN